MTTENILVPLGRSSPDLNALYHAFALSERINAKVYVLFLENEPSFQARSTPMEKACREMIHSACEEGMTVSFHIARPPFGAEFLNAIKTENIDLIVIGAEDTEMESAVEDIRPRVSLQIVKVKGKNAVQSIDER